MVLISSTHVLCVDTMEDGYLKVADMYRKLSSHDGSEEENSLPQGQQADLRQAIILYEEVNPEWTKMLKNADFVWNLIAADDLGRADLKEDHLDSESFRDHMQRVFGKPRFQAIELANELDRITNALRTHIDVDIMVLLERLLNEMFPTASSTRTMKEAIEHVKEETKRIDALDKLASEAEKKVEKLLSYEHLEKAESKLHKTIKRSQGAHTLWSEWKEQSNNTDNLLAAMLANSENLDEPMSCLQFREFVLLQLKDEETRNRFPKYRHYLELDESLLRQYFNNLIRCAGA
eukprot:Filipodium_phascolosomae@DN1514_c0_g1_i1.p1